MFVNTFFMMSDVKLKTFELFFIKFDNCRQTVILFIGFCYHEIGNQTANTNCSYHLVNKQFVSQCLNQLTIAVVVVVVVVILPNWITFSTTQPRICNR